MRLAVPIAIVALAAVLLAGCGDSGDSSGTTAAPPPQAESSKGPAGAAATVCAGAVRGVHGFRVSGVSCRTGQGVIAAWSREEECEPAAGASRSGCAIEDYRCLSVVTERGLEVSCARPGKSVAFRVER